MREHPLYPLVKTFLKAKGYAVAALEHSDG